MPAMRIVSIGLAVGHLAICESMRTRLVRSPAVEVPEDPSWCKHIKDPKRCTAMEKAKCLRACATGQIQPLKPSAEPASAYKPKQLPVVAVTEHTTPQMLTRVIKTSVYKNLWPVGCDGSNKRGKAVVGLNTDGFSCIHEAEGRITSIIDLPNWKSGHHICWKGECVPKLRCDATPLTFWQAASAVALAEAFEVTGVTTESGVEVALQVRREPADVTAKTGVYASVEVKMLENALRFEPSLPLLTDEGHTFFTELGEPLGALVTMQLTAFPDKDMRVLFCAHASTSRPIDDIHPDFRLLPQERADRIASLLEDVLPSERVASLGSAIGHYKDETPGFEGGRDAHIIYKIYDAAVGFGALGGKPACEASDLWQFMMA